MVMQSFAEYQRQKQQEQLSPSKRSIGTSPAVSQRDIEETPLATPPSWAATPTAAAPLTTPTSRHSAAGTPTSVTSGYATTLTQAQSPTAAQQPTLPQTQLHTPQQLPHTNGNSIGQGSVSSARQDRPSLPTVRLPKPHSLFPFDLFHSNAIKGLIDENLERELSYVSDHCMQPPYPWGQVVYHDFLVDNVLKNGNVPGDFAEFGIGQGGTSVFLARLAKKYGRKCLAVDSFEGLPPPDHSKDNHYFVQGDYRPSSGDDNLEAFMRYKSVFDVDDSLHVVKAFFKDVTIPSNFERFSFVHMDSDLYESVYDSLEKVWDRLSPGGAIAVDDFFHHAQGPARAVGDFFRNREEEPPLMFPIPTYAVMIIKGQPACLRYQVNENGARMPIMFAPRSMDGNYYSFIFTRECKAFVKAAEVSEQKAAEAVAKARHEGSSGVIEALERTLGNARDFLDFLRYPNLGARSGCDIFRYLLPLEDFVDLCEGNLRGLPGEARQTIELAI
eukprot:TRINITY_DN8100_c2_g1_i1.p1 TRINITY_DN8100_c2_g1~~TRINITY_DN8100_c2_g1_i1.p1  ORF type:complete len:500 (-),score=79.35 TRINITY_DN8100_c2_g1_i1:106-1605(-)